VPVWRQRGEHHLLLGRADGQLQVLGRVVGGERRRLVVRLRHEHAALRGERLAHHVAALGLGRELGERLLHLLGRLVAHRHAHHGGHRVVLGLRHHLARHGHRVGGVVGDHEQLARARRRVDGAGARHLHLGLGHVGVARADDAVDARHALGAVRHGRHRAGAAQREHPVGAGDGRGGEHHRARQPVGARRRAHHHLLHAGDLGRHHAHEERARVGGAPAGRVHAHAGERVGAAADDHARLGLDLDRLGLKAWWTTRMFSAARSMARRSPASTSSSAARHSARGTSSCSSSAPSNSRAIATSAASPSRRTRATMAAVRARTVSSPASSVMRSHRARRSSRASRSTRPVKRSASRSAPSRVPASAASGTPASAAAARRSSATAAETNSPRVGSGAPASGASGAWRSLGTPPPGVPPGVPSSGGGVPPPASGTRSWPASWHQALDARHEDPLAAHRLELRDGAVDGGRGDDRVDRRPSRRRS
jgi:hypothetical protein